MRKIAALVMLGMALSGCTHVNGIAIYGPGNHVVEAAIIGGIAGGLLGGLAGGHGGDVAIGAGIGAAAGAALATAAR